MLKYLNNQEGFTIIELLITTGIITTVIGIGIAGYIGYHFISKFW